MVVMTTSVLGPKLADADKLLARLQRRAAPRGPGARLSGCRSQCVDAAPRDQGRRTARADQVHLNFAGYRVMTRALLDALGYADVPVPDQQKLEVMPGILPHWKIRAAAEDKPLDAAAVAVDRAGQHVEEITTCPSSSPKSTGGPSRSGSGALPCRWASWSGPAKRYQAVSPFDADEAAAGLFQYRRRAASRLAQRPADFSRSRVSPVGTPARAHRRRAEGRTQCRADRNRRRFFPQRDRRQHLVTTTRENKLASSRANVPCDSPSRPECPTNAQAQHETHFSVDRSSQLVPQLRRHGGRRAAAQRSARPRPTIPRPASPIG